MAGLRIAESFGMRCGLTKRVCQSEHKSIERGQIRGALSGAIADQKLMLEQQRFRGDGADATRAEEFREGDKQVDRQEEQIAHESNVITAANLRKTKTTPQGPLGLVFRNSPPTGPRRRGLSEWKRSGSQFTADNQLPQNAIARDWRGGANLVASALRDATETPLVPAISHAWPMYHLSSGGVATSE